MSRTAYLYDVRILYKRIHRYTTYPAKKRWKTEYIYISYFILFLWLKVRNYFSLEYPNREFGVGRSVYVTSVQQSRPQRVVEQVRPRHRLHLARHPCQPLSWAMTALRITLETMTSLRRRAGRSILHITSLWRKSWKFRYALLIDVKVAYSNGFELWWFVVVVDKCISAIDII